MHAEKILAISNGKKNDNSNSRIKNLQGKLGPNVDLINSRTEP
jgi:hypothetical protein